MTKFKNIKVNGNDNILGDNNNNRITINNRNGNGQNNNMDPVTLAGAVALILISALWWFFKNIDEIYYHLYIGALLSWLPSFLAVALLYFNSSLENKDLYRFIFNIIISLILFELVILAREHAPNDITTLSQITGVLKFWTTMNEYGQNISVINFSSALLVAFSVFANFSSGTRQIFYALANPDRTGLCYQVYDALKHLRLSLTGPIILGFSGLSYALLKGYINV